MIKGYTADKLVVPAVSGVQAGAADTVEVVTYVKDAQKRSSSMSMKRQC